ncbi:MAG: UDP-N-acetylglucosamine 1-carboxyvinyltransferase, partial [Clostridia bacterium]|nr:UDP-N-acetylglucosamine 1-carboxyvinyltransferase [Clostridia bacterium]
CTLLSGRVFLENAPCIKDVEVMAQIIKDLGGDYCFEKNGLTLNCDDICKYEVSCEICKRARASFFIAGGLLSRFKRAVLHFPGGCAIGDRPIDIHLSVFNQLGAVCTVDGEHVFINGEKMKSGVVNLTYPSVGATVNAICASVTLRGCTLIKNAAKEPEIADLCNFLNLAGYDVVGGGRDEIYVNGQKNHKFKVFSYKPICDRIEAGTFMAAVCACGGEISFNFDNLAHVSGIIKVLKKGGAQIKCEKNRVITHMDSRFHAVNVTADVYPRFPTDMQPQLSALCLSALGKSCICDNVFKGRFGYACELSKFGGKITVSENSAMIVGSDKLTGKCVTATDLRGGAALVIASLSARGNSVVQNAEVIRRGYQNFDKKLRSLGGDVKHLFK